nr:hypothetical protein [Tanacetum cinerariifolium]
MKEWFSYRVQERENEFSMMLNGRRLFQPFLVDGYTMIEAERISFNRKQQKDLRSETYSKFAKLAEDLESKVQLCGKKVVLSLSFTESPRLLQDDKEYKDGLMEASEWGMRDYLRYFFVMLLMTGSMSRLEYVWEKTWHVMAQDVKTLSVSNKINQ